MDGRVPEMPDYVVDALADKQRRAIVAHLRSADGAVSIEALARHLASNGASPDGPTLSAPPSKELLSTLHHVQLPTLDEAGLVEYAPEKGRVAYAGEWVLDRTETADGRTDPLTEILG